MSEPDSISRSAHETFDDIANIAPTIKTMIQASRCPVILTHGNPDADAVSSALAMRALCVAIGATPTLTVAGDGSLPANLEFLSDANIIAQTNDATVSASDLIIYVDCADSSRLGPLHNRIADDLGRHPATINIDHHVTNTRFAKLNLVVPDSASSAEILAHLFDALEIAVDANIATTLLAGLYGDTLGLRTPSTTPASLRTSARLLDAGANLDLIVDMLFRLKPYSTVCLWSEVLKTTQWRGALIWAYINQAMLDDSGADRSEAEGIVNFLAGTIGARAAVMLYEETWGWRVSMRTLSNDVDVAQLLNAYEGGGHPRAAGARLAAGEQARDAFLDDMARLLGPRTDALSTVSLGTDPV